MLEALPPLKPRLSTAPAPFKATILVTPPPAEASIRLIPVPSLLSSALSFSWAAVKVSRISCTVMAYAKLTLTTLPSARVTLTSPATDTKAVPAKVAPLPTPRMPKSAAADEPFNAATVKFPAPAAASLRVKPLPASFNTAVKSACDP